MIGAIQRRLFSKIGIKLAVGFITLLLMLASLATYSSVTGRAALADGIGLASEAIAESLSSSIDRVLYLRGHEVLTVVHGYGVADDVNNSNAVFDAMEDPQAYMDQIDENWTSAPMDVIPQSMEVVLDTNASLILKSLLVTHYLETHGIAFFGEVILTNKYGAIVAATHRPVDYRQSDEVWWQETWGEGTLHYSNIQYDEASGIRGICVCFPVKDEAQDIIGVARAMINILAVAKDVELTALGYETSELKIATSDGRLIFSSRAYVMLQNVSSSAFFELATDQRGHFIANEGEADRLFSYVMSTGYLEYEGNEWLVFLSHSEDEVLGPATELQTRILMVAVLAIALGAVISIALSRSITNPIAVLGDATQRMAKGELNQRITISKKDELGRLAKSFNEMASELELLYSGLDRKVKERTEDLENVNKKLGVLSSITRHDALNQMTIQKGWLGMAMESSKDSTVSDYLSKVEDTTDNLVSFFQFMSQYEEVGINKPQWVEVREALVSAIVGLDLTGTEMSSRLEGVEVFADPMFPKVLHNLISNSLKHGETVTTISLSYSEGPNGLTIVMEDNGVGVPAERKETIFQRGHEAGRRSHGLFLSAEILGMTKISIREVGIVGQGARFEILVPEGKYRFAEGSPSET